MNHRDEVREFLTSRRAKITPEQAGLPAGTRRRVPGLRRAEVAILASVSAEYYAQLERGDLAGASDAVLDALARALRLDEAERSHLFDLARAANRAPAARPRHAASRQWTPRPGLQQALDAIGTPAYVQNGRLDVVASNRLGRAFHLDLHAGQEPPANLARFCFLDTERSQRFYADWEAAADLTVAILRTEAGRDLRDQELLDLVCELSGRSEAFRTRWAAHDVRFHASGVKTVNHPVVGEIEIGFESLNLDAEPGLAMLIYSAAPGSDSDERLRLLASWAASTDLPGHPALRPSSGERAP
ncbi:MULTISPECIES: helix-turn-helix transcriptional regulator [Glycomyces]|uniref:Helix-turn-helix transcriptional regulator n=2 Tax=Glycomyces TaxID=58113 RepID=A0A9X3PMC5_9ACTN|nr:helix-turn-helix transcriptional regulator [Glycomyces lechevalierae]MDA1387880.1 helix-turn-helix transcriptional regulator [Glycomyces lechevalierae]MDR7336548.1 transcriptional regulator with XRE-family HTH domain [Glycomyces lechevalierae]